MAIFHEITPDNRRTVNEFLKEHWYATTMVLRGDILDMTKAEGFFLEAEGAILALLTYRFDGTIFEILSLDSLRENEGTGTQMVDEAVRRLMAPGEQPKAPGRKYRHYAPRAPVTVVKGDADMTAGYIVARMGEKSGVICFDEFRGYFRAT